MSIQRWASVELSHSKSNRPEVQWGRRLIQSIDLDDYLALVRNLEDTAGTNYHINTQTNVDGYAGYIWTVEIHNYLGDTALHFALRGNRLYCVYMLLLLGADATIPNQMNVTPGDMCLEIYKQSYQNMKYDAKRKIMAHHHPFKLHELPRKLFPTVNIQEEAWELMKNGSFFYSELPNALKQNKKTTNLDKVSSKTRKRLSFNPVCQEEAIKKAAEKRKEDEDYYNKLKKPKDKMKDQKAEDIFQQWLRCYTDDGRVYFYNKHTGESSWEQPDDWRELPVEEPASSIDNKNKNSKSDIVSEEYNDGDSDSYDETNAKLSNSQLKLPIEDVWTKGTIDDIVNLINRQKKNYELRQEALATRLSVKGLSLLASVKVGGEMERLEEKEDLILTKGVRDLYEVPEELVKKSKAGIGNVPFVKTVEELQVIAEEVKLQPKTSSHLTSPSMKQSNTITDKILIRGGNESNKLSQSGSIKMPSTLGIPGKQTDTLIGDATRNKKDLYRPAYREVAIISTHINLKYMRICDDGVIALSNALENDNIIHTINLSNARCTDIGATALASVLGSIKNLRYLDLSMNAITNKGAIALANSIRQCSGSQGNQIEVICLSGNRIGLSGAMALLEAVFERNEFITSTRPKFPHKEGYKGKPIKSITLWNNSLSASDKESLLKLLEENEYDLNSASGKDVKGRLFRHREHSQHFHNYPSLRYSVQSLAGSEELDDPIGRTGFEDSASVGDSVALEQTSRSVRFKSSVAASSGSSKQIASTKTKVFYNPSSRGRRQERAWNGIVTQDSSDESDGSENDNEDNQADDSSRCDKFPQIVL